MCSNLLCEICLDISYPLFRGTFAEQLE
uniref:Uncharacterized protein n=1 Tax=Anguilla anguilla TaxID=7936 RepID=A0A0E9TUN3_ANGAN